MHQSRWINMVMAMMALLLASSCSPEDRARREVEGLIRLAVPPESACVSEPYIWGTGNNPKNCQGHAVQCVVGSSLTRQKIQDYYTQHFGAGWVSADTQDPETFSWRKNGAVFDKMIGIEYEPKYLPADSTPGREFMEASQSRTTAYVLTVMANKCTGPFP